MGRAGSNQHGKDRVTYYRTLRSRPVVPPPLPPLIRRTLIIGTLLGICLIALLLLGH